MVAAVDPLLARIAELAPEEAIEVASEHPDAESRESGGTFGANAPAGAAVPVAATARSAATQALPQARSVRILPEWLDRMMNAVGELVITRTRMLGRLTELAKLVEVLQFSKTRLAGKVSDFQEKHEFSRISSRRAPGGRQPLPTDTLRPSAGPLSPISTSDLLEFSDLEMDRYDDFNILSRSLTEISADVSEVLAQLEGFMGRVDSDIDEFTKLAHHLQDEITAARMVPIGNPV